MLSRLVTHSRSIQTPLRAWACSLDGHGARFCLAIANCKNKPEFWLRIAYQRGAS
jgi:hypothetical protein